MRVRPRSGRTRRLSSDSLFFVLRLVQMAMTPDRLARLWRAACSRAAPCESRPPIPRLSRSAAREHASSPAKRANQTALCSRGRLAKAGRHGCCLCVSAPPRPLRPWSVKRCSERSTLTPIDNDARSRDPAGSLRRQKRDHVTDFLRRTEAAERQLLLHELRDGVRGLLLPFPP